MNTQSISKAGALSIVAATMMFAASLVLAGDKPSMSGSRVELKSKAVPQAKVDVKDLDEQVSHLEVIDSNGNAYLLIPLKTADGKSPVVAQDGKIIVEYVHPYIEPINR
jgi:FlaG/FlaF family flagellin (archaellin)